MPKPLKSVVRSIRLTEEEDAQFDRMIGYRKLWSFTDLVAAGLALLWQEFEVSRTPPPPAPPPPATTKRKRK